LFQAGAAVDSVIFDTDVSQIRIVNLPPDSTKESVAQLITGLGVNWPQKIIVTIHRAPDNSNGRDCADLQAVSRSFSTAVFTALQDGMPENPDIGVILIPNVYHLSTFSTRQFSNTTVEIAWPRRVVSAVLRYADPDAAQRAQQEFESNRIRIQGQSITVNAVVSMSGDSSRDASDTVTGLCISFPSVDATVREIVEDIPSAFLPERIEVVKSTYGTNDAEVVLSMVKSIFRFYGPCRWWDNGACSDAAEYRAQAIYSNNVDAETAARRLNNLVLPFSQNVRLDVHVSLVVSFIVDTQAFDAVRAQTMPYRLSRIGQKLKYTCTELAPHNGYTILRISGQNTEEFTQSIRAFDKAFSGHPLEVNGRVVWNPAFRHDNIFEILRYIEVDLNVAILRDLKRSTLWLHGPETDVAYANQMLAEGVGEFSDRYTIPLTPSQYVWAFIGGFELLCRTLGPGVAILNIASETLELDCVRSDFDTAYEMITTEPLIPYQQQFPALPAAEVVCCVCAAPLAELVRLACHHLYCQGCFEGVCLSKVPGRPAILCRGNMGHCRKKISLTDLHANLPQWAFEKMLENAMEVYVSQRTDIVKVCPTESCSYYYRAHPVSSNSSPGLSTR
jgi:hypothetical protein